MRYEWSTLEQAVQSLLKDSNKEGKTQKYDTADLITWWNFAQDALATTRPLHKHLQYVGVQSGAAPTDYYKSRAVVLPDGTPIEEIQSEQMFFDPNIVGFYVYEGEIVTVNTGYDSFTLLYDAYYPHITNEHMYAILPSWAVEACTMYVGMLAMTREAAGDARYRKFITKNDAGNPTQNPFLGVAKWMESRYNKIVSAHIDDSPHYGA